MEDRPPKRYHAMDALRAGMMLMVVVLHGATFYTDRPEIKVSFRFTDPDQGPGFDVLVVSLQQLSMPAFFLASGFFTAMLASRRGDWATLANRFKRITLPFVVFWLPLYVLVLSGIFFGCMIAEEVTVRDHDDIGLRVRHIGAQLASGQSLSEALSATDPQAMDMLRVESGQPSRSLKPLIFAGPGLQPSEALAATARLVPLAASLFFRAESNSLGHLWFLWMLTLFALATAFLGPVARQVSTAWLTPLLGSFAFPLALALPLALAFNAHGLPYLPTARRLIIPWPTLYGYAIFFGTGALLWRHRAQLPAVGKWWPFHMILAGLSLPSAVWLHHHDGGGQTEMARWAIALLAAIAHFQLSWAAIGFCHCFFDRERSWVRYVSDSSYWIYLVHLPIVIWSAAILLPWDASRYIKFPLVLTAGIGVPLVSYHLFVRHTLLGVLLGGNWATWDRPH